MLPSSQPSGQPTLSPDIPPLPVPFVSLRNEGRSATAIDPGEVHLWSCSTAISYAAMANLHAHLAPEEAVRAERFTHPGARQRFVVSRGGLRAILGNHFAVEPASIPLDVTPLGKPVLGGALRQASVSFSISHAGEAVMIAIGHGVEVGVDIEKQASTRDYPRIAKRAFGPAERRYLGSGVAKYLDAFYLLWTAREAYLKGIGTGLTGWSGKDIVLGPDGPMSPENSASKWVAFRIPGGTLALSMTPRGFSAWAI